MPSRSPSTASIAAIQLAELASAAPQVIAHRLTGMANSGPVLSASNRKEFKGTVQEKRSAITQSWLAMATEAARIQQSPRLAWMWPAYMLAPLGCAKVWSDLLRGCGWTATLDNAGLVGAHQ